MRDHRSSLPRRLAQFGCLAVLALALGPAGGAVAASGHGSTKTKRSTAKPKTPLAGWLGNGTKFPARALVLSAPAGTKLNAANVHVTENGVAAGPLTVTPTAQAQPNDFGVLVLADLNPSMAGAPITAVINATRTLAADRAGQQEVGLIAFDSIPSVFLRLTSDGTAINTGLSRPTFTGKGPNAPAAIRLALQQLAQAKVALGAIIVVSDGVGIGPASNGATAQAAAAAAHVPIFTVGLQDHASTAASLQRLSKAAPGQFVQTPTSRLTSVVKEIYSALTSGYVVRWRSNARAGQAVDVAANATGVPGTVSVSYKTPAPLLAPKHVATSPALSSRGLSSRISTLNRLSPLPSFARETPVTPSAPSSGPTQGFWASAAAVPAIAIICGLLLAAAIAFGLHRPSHRAVRMRVGSFIPEPVGADDPLGIGHGSDPDRRGLFRAFEHGRWWPPFVQDVEVSRNPRTPVQLVKRAAATGVVLALVLTLVSGSVLLGMVPLLGWPFALRMIVKRAARKQREKFKDVLPGYLQDLASALRVGRSFVAGISAVAETADEPIRSELERAVTDEAFGRPLEASLEAVAVRMQASDMDQVAMIAGLNRRTGSNVAESLDRVAEGARDRADLRREMKALTGQAKMSSMVLTSLPAILLLGINLVSPLYAHPLFHTTLGIVLLCVGACMVFAGWRVMKKITDVEP